MTSRASAFNLSIHPRRYAAEFSIVRFAMPVTPHSIAAPTSATSSSREYDSDPNGWRCSTPSRPTRAVCPVECVNSWNNVE